MPIIVTGAPLIYHPVVGRCASCERNRQDKSSTSVLPHCRISFLQTLRDNRWRKRYAI